MSGGDDERLSAAWSMLANAIAKGDQIEQLFLRRTSAGYVLECRGRTGERIAHRAVTLSFKHCAFKSGWREEKVGSGPVSGAIPFGRSVEKTLQFDENGEIRLGALADIEEIRTKDFGGWRWRPERGVGHARAGRGISCAEGETVAIPARGLFDGAWPGAERLESRVSLLAVNKSGEITEDCIGACSYSNGVLRIAGLRAGDYSLKFRTENSSPVKISVAKTAKGVGEGGVIASAARALADTGDPDGVRIESAEVAANGTLRVRVANAGPDARVHVFAARMTPVSGAATPFSALASALCRPQLLEGAWGVARTDYISGRDLGDKLRYILDRRQEPGRIGNMLQRPSLLLNPWTTSETDTKDLKFSDGDKWESVAAECAEAPGILAQSRGGGAYGDVVRSGFACFDFIPAPAAVFANLRPGKDGVVEVDLRSGAAGMQDVSVVVTDGRSIDEARLAGALVPFAPRDLRVKRGFDALANASRTKSYSTVGELYDLMLALNPGAGAALREFAFLVEWDAKNDEEKRALYGKYASHELDFFLYEKDRAFFDAVVAPHLKNKRFKEFMDKWLLGEDVSAYAKPGRFQDLNALEQCLLARRVASMAPVVARNLADWCAANPVDPDEDDRRLSIALAEMEVAREENVACAEIEECELASPDDTAWVPAYAVAPQGAAVRGKALRGGGRPVGRDGMVADVESNWSSQRLVAAPEKLESAGFAPRMSGALGAARRREAEVKRRSARQFWRPPERTKEWVESHWYRRRHGEETLPLAPASRFWRDYAAAIAEGRESAFRSAAVIDAADTLTDMVAALAVTRLGFAAKEGESVVFTRGGAAAGGETVRVERHFFDAAEGNEDGSPKEVTDEFVRGTAYKARTIVMNPTSRQLRVRVVSQLPEGAFPLSAGLVAEDLSLVLPPYGVQTMPWQEFYFPCDGADVGRAAAAVAVERGVRVGASAAASCNVVAEPSKRDTTSWRYVSQNATNDEVLEYLKTKTLSNVDLSKIGWRFADGDFAKKALDVLESRGAYCQGLWLAGFKWKAAYNERRVKEALSRRENIRKLLPHFGPAFKSSLVEIEPEEADVFEHKEYWPMINARAHAKGGSATIANEALAKEYREFLDVLAAKKSLSARDRLLAAVYLIAQDRVAEAEAHVAAVDAADVETKMQLDYMRAYLAFAHGDAAEGRRIAAKWADFAVGVWRARFKEVVAQADEALGGGWAADGGDSSAAAPSLAIRAETKDGVPEAIVVTARNLASCTLKAYPVDVEIAFSKDPFGPDGAASGGILGMRPAWTEEVALADAKETRVTLPNDLRRSNLMLVASGADGRAEERLALTPGSLDVQVAREARQLRVRRTDGRPLAGAYVKVYARDASGRETKFHKDGYTDLRGAFDYESVSTDTDFRPAEFAVFVQGAEGVRTLRVPAK